MVNINDSTPETVNVYTEVGDFVTCTNCNAVMLLPIGADKCPECKKIGCLKWMDNDLQETDIDGLLARHCNLHQKKEVEPEEYLSHEVLVDEFPKYPIDTDYLIEGENFIRVCPVNKCTTLVKYLGKERCICLHDDSQEEDRKAVDNWIATQTMPVLDKDNPELFTAWQAGKAEMHIASLSYFRVSDKQPLGGCDNVFYEKRQAMRSLVDYFVDENLEKLKDVYYVCEVRLFAPTLEERMTYPSIQSIFDLSDYSTVKPYYSHQINYI
ncbi:hypothetical protein DW228_06365 [Bacteroides fragilis]|uniref:Uncharacterized protein n=1 Tax=Bacteroides fragilis TaxID=817 RepID=A0A396C1I6_BACFG|nr:hypothetical protein [Bacteroides fragilis]RHH14421.1 hypothetical protein DW228_06365 [Bacteroides fragilis]